MNGTTATASQLVTRGRRRLDLGRIDPTCTAGWHGTYTAYRKGCRCPHAREAHRLYQKRAREGRNQPALIDATGSRRRVQGLWALGHSSQAIAEQCGKYFDRTQIVRVCRQTLITPHHRDLLATVYRKLCILPGDSVRTRNRALGAGYALPIQWGPDIDDPNAVPEPLDTDEAVDHSAVDEVVIERVLAGARFHLNDAELLIAAPMGVARGIATGKLADLLGVSDQAVQTLLQGQLPRRRAKHALVDAEVRRIGHLHDTAALASMLGVHHTTVARSRERMAQAAGRAA